MRSARQSAVRLLQWMMIASLVLPAVLFVFASWINYRNAWMVADERIDRSLDILHEHALKVIQTVERATGEIEEVLRGLSDEEIRAQQARLHNRFAQIVAAMPQTQAVVIVDRHGHPLASSNQLPVDPNVDFSDRGFFKEQQKRETGTYVSRVLAPLGPEGTFFFNLSRRREAPDGTFNGIVAIAVLPSYFNEFYGRIGRSPGSYYAMARSDGVLLARYPGEVDPSRNVLDQRSQFRVSIAQGKDHDIFTVKAQVDGLDRRIGFRKLFGIPVYVLAGVETSAVHKELLGSIGSHLIFGLPATFLMFAIIGLALQRTRRLHDEAERREAAERALRQAQRLEAIGQLTGGVAHDFNNLLMIVSGSVQRLRRDLTGEHDTRLLDMITAATQRGESLTRQLLAFSRRQMHTPTVIDLSRRLPELKDMLAGSLRGDIEMDVVVPRTTCAVKVDASELELALLNLAVNARDAMPNGGTLSITAKQVQLKGKASVEGLRGEFVAIRVADTGMGIPGDVLPHVFEPFFTTKEIGKGTGLGLSQVYGFAKQSGGAATITSMPARGTVITLFLPCTREVPSPPIAHSATVTAVHEIGTVLVVEDNAEVAEVATSYLEQLGCKVKRAASAQGALEVLENETDIDMMFSDILMPGVMTGLDLAQAVRERFPRLPVLLTTGYSSGAQDALRQGFIVLQKPFDLAALKQALRDAQHWHEERGHAAAGAAAS